MLIRPTPRHRTSSPVQPVYMVFQPIRCTAPDVATRTGKLLPHLFTLAAEPWRRLTLTRHSRRLFSVTLLYPRGYLPVRKYGALCCPDFPWLRLTLSHDGTACCVAKVRKCSEFGLYYIIMVIFDRKLAHLPPKGGFVLRHERIFRLNRERAPL